MDLVAVVVDGGVVVSVTGGDFPHVGALALAEPRPSGLDPARTSSTTSVITRLGHKEDELVKNLSDRMSRELDLPVVVSAGIHIDEPSKGELGLAVKLAERAVTECIPRIAVAARGRRSPSRSPS